MIKTIPYIISIDIKLILLFIYIVKDGLQRKFCITHSEAAFTSKCEMTFLQFLKRFQKKNKNNQ